MNEQKKTRTEKLKEELKNQYLKCATIIFEKKGFHETHIKDITDMAGTSVGNFYNYFISKEEIFEELMNTFAHFIIDRIKVLHKYDVPPISEIEGLFRAYIDMFQGKSELALIYLEQMGGINQKFRALKKRLDSNATKEIKVIIDKLIEINYIPKQDAELTSRIWLGAIMETYRWWVDSEFRIHAKDIVNQLANFLAIGTVKKRFT